MILFLRVSAQHNDYLALGRALLEMGYDLCQRTANALLMHLGNLPADTHLTVSSINFGKLLEKYPDLVSDKPVAEVQTYIQNDCMDSYYLWGSLNDEQKGILTKAATETRDWQRQLCRDLEDKFAKTIVEGGAEINDDVDKQAFIDATKSVWELYSKKYGNETIDAIVNVK